jgi:hypothetical protein
MLSVLCWWHERERDDALRDDALRVQDAGRDRGGALMANILNAVERWEWIRDWEKASAARRGAIFRRALEEQKRWVRHFEYRGDMPQTLEVHRDAVADLRAAVERCAEWPLSRP